MNLRVYRSYGDPKREGLSWDERWQGYDKGLVTCWEVVRELRQKNPELAERARRGELPVLGWKGGVEKVTKIKEKYGSLKYLAQWQGLRGEDLNVDLSQEIELICSKAGIKVTYTGNAEKFSNP